MLKSPAAAGVVGGVIGAALSLAAVFGAAALGAFPTPDSRIHDYLVTHPQVLVEISNRLQAQQDANEDDGRQKSVDRLGLKPFFNPRFAFVTGAASAPTTFVEFFDYNCPYCRASLPTVKNFLAAHKNDARVALIEFPIKGPQSTFASRAAIAARRQPDKYLAFHFLLMGEKELVTEEVVLANARKAGLNIERLRADMQDRSVDMAIAAAHNLAAAARVDGTPAFIVNGHAHEGALDDASLRQLLKTKT